MNTVHEYRGYVFTIHYEPKQPAYSVDFPDVPEIITSGDSLPQAFAGACEALDLHLESLQKLNLPLPLAKHRLVLQKLRVPDGAAELSERPSRSALHWGTLRFAPGTHRQWENA